MTSVPILNLPNLYMNGYQIASDSSFPNTLLDLGIGQCRDSSNTYDITLSTAVKCSTLAKGVNGLDNGTIAASSSYALYVIDDPVQGNPTASLLSLASNAVPTMPAGYSAYRIVGYAVTDGSSHLIPGYWQAGNSSNRYFYYSAPQALSLPGASTTPVGLSLTPLVPALANIRAGLAYSYTPAVAADTVKFKNFSAANYAITISGQVAAIAEAGYLEINTTLSGGPSIVYVLSSASDALTLSVISYQYNL